MRALSPIQCALLKLLKRFSVFCAENHIEFFAVAGTAIGAVRHKGFIPWDDDLDIGMTLDNYQRFLGAVENLPNDLGFVTSLWMGGKIFDPSTTVVDIRMLTRPKQYYGLYIDIFPFIGTPNDRNERDFFLKKLRLYNKQAELSEQYPEISPFRKPDLEKEREELMHAYSLADSEFAAAFCLFLQRSEGIRNLKEVSFEDCKICVSSTYDWDLKNHFGDYMTLPPKEQRKTHDKYHIIDLDKPFTDYQEDFYAIYPWLREILEKKQVVEGEQVELINSLFDELENKNKELDSIHRSRAYKFTRKLANLRSKI